MSKIARAVLAAAVLALASVAGAHAQHAPPESKGVHAAVLDYVEGFYEGDSTKLVRSVSPAVYKYGYGRRGDAYVGMQMPYAQFMAFANGVKAGRNQPPANAPKEIVLFDVQDQTASAKLTAWWGTDYLLLAKQDGRWLITHVLWQSPPPAR